MQCLFWLLGANGMQSSSVITKARQKPKIDIHAVTMNEGLHETFVYFFAYGLLL